MALAVMDVQGPRSLVSTQYGLTLILWRMRTDAKTGTGEADSRRSLSFDDTQLPVDLAPARRQVRRTHRPKAPVRTHSRPLRTDDGVRVME